jgi:hypothetical protein
MPFDLWRAKTSMMWLNADPVFSVLFLMTCGGDAWGG